MSGIIDDIQSARDKLPLPAPGAFAYRHVDAARKATHEESDGYYMRDSLIRAAAELIVAIEILDRADKERR